MQHNLNDASSTDECIALNAEEIVNEGIGHSSNIHTHGFAIYSECVVAFKCCVVSYSPHVPNMEEISPNIKCKYKMV